MLSIRKRDGQGRCQLVNQKDRAAQVLRAAQAGEKSDTVRRAIAFALGQTARGTP